MTNARGNVSGTSLEATGMSLDATGASLDAAGVRVNPRGVEGEYLACLNRCFEGWGDARQFDWYFRREVGGLPPADLMLLEARGRAMAGSAVCYRRVALPSGREIGVGVMTGSWTLPEFRGRGCFARVIEESERLAAGKGCALLLAFVTEENASCRQLARAGAAMFPSFYAFTTPRTPKTVERGRELVSLGKGGEVVGTIFERHEAGRRGRARFVYQTAEDFGAQFVSRPGPVEVYGDARGNVGVVEERGDTDALQLHLAAVGEGTGVADCVAAFAGRAIDKGRKLFLYSTRPEVAATCRALGLAVKPGRLAALVADASRLREALGVATRSTISESAALAEVGGPLYVGPWDVQSGDRT